MEPQILEGRPLPADIEQGDRAIRAAEKYGHSGTELELATTHYLRSIALSLDTLAGLAVHEHEQHGQHGDDLREDRLSEPDR